MWLVEASMNTATWRRHDRRARVDALDTIHRNVGRAWIEGVGYIEAGREVFPGLSGVDRVTRQSDLAKAELPYCGKKAWRNDLVARIDGLRAVWHFDVFAYREDAAVCDQYRRLLERALRARRCEPCHRRWLRYPKLHCRRTRVSAARLTE